MLESFKELFTSTASTAAQRVRNPALGAFAMSWCAFNWKLILFLFLSDADVLEKINYISTNSTWKTVIGYPCVSVILICGFLPWVNNVISKWQSKPLDNNDSIENHRKAKQILRATRLQRLQAKKDVMYDKVKTGAEKDIQTMKEQITESQLRMGTLTEERDNAISLLQDEISKTSQLEKTIIKQNGHISVLQNDINKLRSKVEEYESNIQAGKSIFRVGGVLSGLKGVDGLGTTVESFSGSSGIPLTPGNRNKN